MELAWPETQVPKGEGQPGGEPRRGADQPEGAWDTREDPWAAEEP